MMIPVEAHLFLNHVPLVGLVFGLVFFVVGLMRASEPALWTGIRIFLAMGIAILPVAGSGLMSATILSGLPWLDLDALNDHRLAGILAAVVVGGLGIICAVVLFRAKGTSQSLSAQTRRAVLLFAVAGVGANLWAAYLGGSLRHSELTREESGLSRGR